MAPGSRFTKGGGIGESNNHLVLLAENLRGVPRTSSSWSPPATPRGSTTGRASTRSCWRSTRAGLIGLSSCLKGEVPSHLRAEQEQRAVEAAATYRDILGPGNFFLEMQYQGIDDQRAVNVGLQRVAKALDLPLVCTNDVHYLHREDCRAARHPAVHRHRQDRQRRRAPAVPRRPVLPEVARGDGARCSGTSRRRWRTPCAIAERCDVDLDRRGTSCRSSRCRPAFTLDEYFEHMVVGRVRAAAAAAEARWPRGQLRHRSTSTEQRLAYEIDDDQADGVRRVLPDRLGLHPLRARAGHPGRAGPRVGGRQPRGLLPATSPTSTRCTST